MDAWKADGSPVIARKVDGRSAVARTYFGRSHGHTKVDSS